MSKIKLIVLIVFQLFIASFNYGQVKITFEGYEKAVDFANCKYVIYSLTNNKERQTFIENCDCDKDPAFTCVLNAISSTKTKTIAFSKAFNELKELEIEMNQGDIAAFLTDSIFNSDFNPKFKRITNYGNSRRNDQDFIKYKKELFAQLTNLLDDHIVPSKVKDKMKDIVENSESSETIVYKQKRPEWYDELDFPSIAVSVLISILLIGFLYSRYIKNRVSKNVEDFVHKKVSGSYFDKRFDENQLKINNLKKEIQELKEHIKESQASKKD